MSLTLPIIAIIVVVLSLFLILGIVWLKRDRTESTVKNNAATNKADIIILVGSETSKTWDFATALHNALISHNHKVRTIPMNELAKKYKKARHLFVLTSTFGDGDAPKSASHFMQRLEHLSPPTGLKYTVLGFGSRDYPKFCQYAKDVELALRRKGLTSLMALTLIDQQSAQQFETWGRELSACLSQRLTLNYVYQRPSTIKFKLIAKADFGRKTNTPISILRFEAPLNCSNFSAGDLIGIVAPHTQIERYYSLASSRQQGVVEFCVRKQDRGVCSTYLCNLRVGQSVDGAIKGNIRFKAPKNNKPLILIGAGTGIGPLIGLIRENINRRDIYLYWGARDPESDFLYKQEIDTHLENKTLTEFTPAFSRIQKGCYVQDKLMSDTNKIKALIKNNALIMVCGGTQMAADVEATLNKVIQSTGTNVNNMKKQKRYIEDIY